MLKKIKYKYYVESFIWSTLDKLIKAIVNFISVPILLALYGENNYGILSLAISANAYIVLLDLGINVGAVKYFSQWQLEGKKELIDSVSRTNITFYIIIGCINAFILILLGLFGENIFSVTREQFKILRICFFIISVFSISNWVSTAFNQLLVAYGNIAFVQQMQSLVSFLQLFVILLTVYLKLDIIIYFFVTLLINSIVLFIYAFYCRYKGFISSVLPFGDWKNFNIVLSYSLNIFILSLFQITATNSRAIILGIFSDDASKVSTEFKIISVAPSFILAIGGMVSPILLPKASQAVALNNTTDIQAIAYKGTFITSILANVLCFPFILCASDFLFLYVGVEYVYLSKWLILWCLTILMQIHTTPCTSLILAYGKTSFLVIISAFSCMLSIFINILLIPSFSVGAAIVGYMVYVVLVIMCNYGWYYNKILGLNGLKIFIIFLYHLGSALIAFFALSWLPHNLLFFYNSNVSYLIFFSCLFKSFFWLLIYTIFCIVGKRLLK